MLPRGGRFPWSDKLAIGAAVRARKAVQRSLRETAGHVGVFNEQQSKVFHAGYLPSPRCARVRRNETAVKQWEKSEWASVCYFHCGHTSIPLAIDSNLVVDLGRYRASLSGNYSVQYEEASPASTHSRCSWHAFSTVSASCDLASRHA